MSRTEIKTQIDAPLSLVFDTVAHIENFSKAVPHILRTEFLSEQKSGVGTRFREVRAMGGREASNDLEITEFKENDHVRIVTDSHGAVWDTLFTVRASSGGTELVMTMEARPYKLLPRLMIPLTKGMVRKAIVGDMQAVKQYCESA